jgi:hypothetical protein
MKTYPTITINTSGSYNGRQSYCVYTIVDNRYIGTIDYSIAANKYVFTTFSCIELDKSILESIIDFIHNELKDITWLK